jgi:hypothetical protein
MTRFYSLEKVLMFSKEPFAPSGNSKINEFASYPTSEGSPTKGRDFGEGNPFLYSPFILSSVVLPERIIRWRKRDRYTKSTVWNPKYKRLSNLEL